MSELFKQARHSTYRQFDQVRIIDVTNAVWLFTPPVHDVTGTWTVAAVMANSRMLLITRNSALVRIPLTGVQKIATYSLEAIEAQLKASSGYEQRQEKGSSKKATTKE